MFGYLKIVMGCRVNYMEKDEGRVFVTGFIDWEKSIADLVDGCGLIERLPKGGKVLLKPNLVEAVKPPITTPVELVAALIKHLQQRAPGLEVIVGEGVGAKDYDTWHSFAMLGYTEMARQLDVELVDLNEAELVRLENKICRRLPEIYLPKIALESFLISLPMLKAHTLAGVTLTMKNMMGMAPPSHYQQGGHWKKASFHTQIQEAILDLNRYRHPDFTIMDATIGMIEAHLWGPTCEPPPNQLVAGFDPVAVDAYGCALLARDWQEIGHIQMAQGELGRAEPLEVAAI